MNRADFKKRQEGFICKHMSKEEMEIRKILYRLVHEPEKYYEDAVKDLMEIIDDVDSAERL